MALKSGPQSGTKALSKRWDRGKALRNAGHSARLPNFLKL
jgi:hypothetical protein